MNNDILINAAKGAGYEVRSRDRVVFIDGSGSLIGGNSVTRWNPLESNADAFQLLIDCEIDLMFGDVAVFAESKSGLRYSANFAECRNDKKAAARSVITQAAARMAPNDQA